MTKTILVAGYGPGISNSVAERFGREGFSIALVGRNERRLAEGVKALAGKGIDARPFPGDLGNAGNARDLVKKVRSALGPLTVVQWSAYTAGAGDLTKADAAELRPTLEIATVSLVAAVQEALPDLRSQKGAVLVTNGGLGYFDPAVDAVGVSWNAMGLSVANSAKHKLVRLLHQKLKDEGVYVGEVMVTGSVKGTAYDNGTATLEPAAIAEKFWSAWQSRKDVSIRI